MIAAITGAVLLELQKQTGSSTEQAAMLLTWQSLGRLLGVILIGGLFDHVNQMLLLACSMTIGSISSAVVPWCSSYVALVFPMIGAGLETGSAGGSKCVIAILGSIIPLNERAKFILRILQKIGSQSPCNIEGSFISSCVKVGLNIKEPHDLNLVNAHNNIYSNKHCF